MGGIHTRAAGQVCPPHRRLDAIPAIIDTGEADHRYGRGEQMGHFMLGSSVILLTGPDAVNFDAGLARGQPVRLNQPLGTLVPRRLKPRSARSGKRQDRRDRILALA